MPAQLRIYDIKPGKMDAFIGEFREKIAPSRRRHGFEILGPWVAPERNQFVWIASYEGPLNWEDAVERYYHSPERSSLDFDADDYIDSMNLRMLERT